MASDSLSEQVYDTLLERLLSGKWVPGFAFNRRQVAAELGVSVAPVLEAMLELQAEGLIETLPRKGTRVRVWTLADLRGQLIVREALECQAARLYCGEPVRRNIEGLLKSAAMIDGPDVGSAECVKQEVQFHHRLVSLAGVPALTEAYERVMKAGLLYSIQVLNPARRSSPPPESHEQLVHKLASGDADAAEAAARRHVQWGREALYAETTPGQVETRTPSWLKV